MRRVIRRQGIFLKIYLWFWVTTALILVVQMGLDRFSDRRPPLPFHLEQTQKPLFVFYGHNVVRQYLDGNINGIVESRGKLLRVAGIDSYVVNEAGIEVTGRQMPENIRAIVQRAMRSGLEEMRMVKHDFLLALPIRERAGSPLFVAGRIARPPLPPLPPPRNPAMDLSRLLVVLLISAGVCYALARYLTMPIVRLREAAQRFTKGELSVRVGQRVIGRNDEFGRLGEDFDRMAQRIEGLILQQRQLLGDISHELRSPLARLSLALELARRKSGPEAEADLHRIATEAATLEEMIAHVLTLTRLESGIDGIETDEVDLEGLVKAVVSDADFEAQGRGGTVRIAQTVGCVVRGNEELLRRAVENVVRNAVRYTREGTPVEVALRRVGDGLLAGVEIRVRDYGPGVPEADLPRLFHPFYRVSNARDRQSGGTGLGLAITDRAVRLHGGKVVAANMHGGGLAVMIRLPLHGPTDRQRGSVLQ